jgi:CRISPR-associated protein Cas2
MDLSARTVFLVTYDVCDQKRLTRTRNVLLGFGSPVQLSVFRCELTAREMVDLRVALTEVFNMDEDQALFADLGPAEGRGSDSLMSLGRAMGEVTRSAVVL